MSCLIGSRTVATTEAMESFNCAIVLNNSTLVEKAILDGSVDPNELDDEGFTALHRAVFYECRKVVSVLLNNHIVQPNTGNFSGETPFFRATQEDSFNLIKIFFGCNRVNFDTPDISGMTPFHVSLECADERISSLFIDCPKVNKRVKTRNNITPLHLAAANGKVRAVQYILQEKIYVGDVDNDGRNALHYASGNDGFFQSEIVSLLLKGGVDPNAVDVLGRTALHIAAEAGAVSPFFTMLYDERVSMENILGISRVKVHEDIQYEIKKALTEIKLFFASDNDID